MYLIGPGLQTGGLTGCGKGSGAGLGSGAGAGLGSGAGCGTGAGLGVGAATGAGACSGLATGVVGSRAAGDGCSRVAEVLVRAGWAEAACGWLSGAGGVVGAAGSLAYSPRTAKAAPVISNRLATTLTGIHFMPPDYAQMVAGSSISPSVVFAWRDLKKLLCIRFSFGMIELW